MSERKTDWLDEALKADLKYFRKRVETTRYPMKIEISSWEILFIVIIAGVIYFSGYTWAFTGLLGWMIGWIFREHIEEYQNRRDIKRIVKERGRRS